MQDLLNTMEFPFNQGESLFRLQTFLDCGHRISDAEQQLVLVVMHIFFGGDFGKLLTKKVNELRCLDVDMCPPSRAEP